MLTDSLTGWAFQLDLKEMSIQEINRSNYKLTQTDWFGTTSEVTIEVSSLEPYVLQVIPQRWQWSFSRFLLLMATIFLWAVIWVLLQFYLLRPRWSHRTRRKYSKGSPKGLHGCCTHTIIVLSSSPEEWDVGQNKTIVIVGDEVSLAVMWRAGLKQSGRVTLYC